MGSLTESKNNYSLKPSGSSDMVMLYDKLIFARYKLSLHGVVPISVVDPSIRYSQGSITVKKTGIK